MADRRLLGKIWALLMVALWVAALQTSAASWVQDDAGSGRDAGSIVEESVMLLSLGDFTGNLTPDDLSDWYGHKARQRHDPQCVSSTIRSDYALQTHLVAVSQDRTYEAETTSRPLGESRISLATMGIKGVFLNTAIEGVPAVSAIKYDFGVSIEPHGQLGTGDADSGGDAGDTLATALPTKPCSGGTIGGDDTADAYAFSGSSGEDILVSLATDAADAKAVVETAGGSLVGIITASGIDSMRLPNTGDYLITLTSSAAEPTSYTLAMCASDCGPPTEPCEPACLEVLATES